MRLLPFFLFYSITLIPSLLSTLHTHTNTLSYIALIYSSYTTAIMKTTCSKPQDKDTTSISRSITVANSPISACLRFCGNILSSSSPPSSSSSTQKQQINPPPPSNSTLNYDLQQHNSSSNSTTITDQEAEEQGHKLELQRVFTYFDENGDGKISASELQSCFRTVGGGELSDEDADKAIRTSDADGDGMLGFDDFTKLMETGEDDDKIQELREAFSMYSSGSGFGSATQEYITPKSLKKMLTRLGKPATTTNCKAMIRKFDLNGDGVLNFDEFRVMMMR